MGAVEARSRELLMIKQNENADDTAEPRVADDPKQTVWDGGSRNREALMIEANEIAGNMAVREKLAHPRLMHQIPVGCGL